MARKVLITVLFLGLLGAYLMSSDFTYQATNVFASGEELIYKVKWSFIRVGTLRLVNEGWVKHRGGEYYKLRIYIDSAPGIPFVNIHDSYESYVDSNSVPAAFYAWEDKGDYTLKTSYFFDYEEKHVEVKITKIFPNRTVMTEHKKVALDQTYRDVLSLLYFARTKAGERGRNLAIPTFVLAGRDTCYFYEFGKVSQVEYNGEKQDSYYLEGKVKFIGIAGIRDDFEGWFSMDSQRVPLKAKMKAFFGSVTIELESSENWLASRN